MYVGVGVRVRVRVKWSALNSGDSRNFVQGVPIPL